MLGATKSRSSRLFALALCSAALSSGCTATAIRRAPLTTVEQRIAEASAEGIVLENPLEIDDDMKAAAAKMVGRIADPALRLRHLARFLTDSGFINFQYTLHKSYTAKQAFRERRGDCMAYTNLFLALARSLGIDAHFVHVREVQNYYERGGWFFVSSHIAVGYGMGPSAEVIDFAKEITDWKLALYSAISDDAALSLYYNNVAVDHMVGGRPAEAERLLRFWVKRQPEVAELYNNLGVLLNRQQRYREALPVLHGAIRRFPSYKPLLTNGLTAARGAGRPDLAVEFEKLGQDADHDDPFFLFAQAMNFYHKDRYAQAAALLERAHDVKSDSPVILAWLTRAYLGAGKREQALAVFEKVKALKPSDGSRQGVGSEALIVDQLLRDLREQFPELR